MRRLPGFLALSLSVLIAGAAVAQTPSGVLGLVSKPVTREHARAIGLALAQGAQVVDLVPGGPAASAGVQVGDVILGIDGQKVEGPDGLAAYVASRRPGMSSWIEVARGRSRLVLRVVLGTPRSGPPRSDVPKAAGGSVRS